MKPHALLDHVIRALKLKNDNALAVALSVDPAVVSMIRNRKYGVSGRAYIRLHELTGEPIAELRVINGEAPNILGRKYERTKVSPEIIDQIAALPRYCEGMDGKLHPGAVSTHSFVSLDKVLAALQS